MTLPRRAGPQARRSPPYSVLVNATALRHQLRLRGLTAAEVARRAKRRGYKVSESTISHALNGYRIHPAKLHAIAAVLHDVEPLPGIDALLETESAPASAGGAP